MQNEEVHRYTGCMGQNLDIGDVDMDKGSS